MLVRPIGTLTVVRYDLSFINGYRYETVFQDGPRGVVNVFFGPVRSYQDRAIYTEFQRAGLKPEDMLADIAEFYPNGRDADENTGENMRQGTGTAVLDMISWDATKHGARAVFVYTGRNSMRSFLRKKGFTPYEPQDTDQETSYSSWYKLLHSPA